MKYLFLVGENVMDSHNTVYVKATEIQMRGRMYVGGFLRFLSYCYGAADKYEGIKEIEGKPILSLEEFDQWRADHNMI